MCNSKSLLLLFLYATAVGAHAQTIQEIETLQRKKVVFDLSKEMGGAATPAAASATANGATTAPTVPAKRAPDQPIIAGMGGDPSDPRRLTVAVMEGSGTTDYRVGDTTSAGWRVVRIGRRDAAFSHPDVKAKTVTVVYSGGANPLPAGAPMPPAGSPVPVSATAR